MSSRRLIRNIVRSSLAFSAIAAVSSVLAMAADLPRPLQPQPLADALDNFAKYTGLQVIYRTELAGGVRSSGAAAGLSPEQALRSLLQGTGLTFQFVDGRTVTILSAAGTYVPGTATLSSDSSTHVAQGGEDVASSSLWERFRLAQLDAPASPRLTDSGASGSQPANSGPAILQEVVVTAQKREERLQDVPIPVTAITGADLLNTNQLRLQDYYAQIPNLTLAPGFYHSVNLAIRGIATTDNTGSTPTVGITIDDVPYGGSWGRDNGVFVPDLDPGDLARVEVLRGPQGTLYGAASLGGLVKFVTIDPSTQEVSGRLEAGTSTVSNGAQLGYNVRGSVNIPLSDSLAIRASAFARLDPGYVDNPVRHVDGINESHAVGGRLAALWRPTDGVSLKLSALFQDDKSDGESDIFVPISGIPASFGLNAYETNYILTHATGLGDLQQNYVPGAGQSERKTQAYSAVLSAKLGSVDLTSVTGYNVNAFYDSYDPSVFFGSYTLGAYQTDESLGYATGTTRKFSEELRLSDSIGKWADWLFGGFYTHEDAPGTNPFAALDPTTGAPIGTYYFDYSRGTYSEYAAFGDLTLHITDRLDLQVGGRESQIRESYSNTYFGPVYGNVTSSQYLASKGNAFTYLFTPQFKISPDLMVYGRFASGYRPGGPNAQPAAIYGTVPASYAPDKTYNYELGVKGDFLEHILSVDASVYYIDWRDIQVGVTTVTKSGYTGNVSQAKSEGMELSVKARPVTGLTLGGWITWGEAVLTQDFPASAVQAGTFGVAGDRLPNTTRLSGNLSLDERFPLGAKLDGFFGATMSYTGNRLWDFTATSYRAYLPPYAKTDLHAGLVYNAWTLNLFANNVADRRGLLSSSNSFYPESFYIIQPRTIGVSVVSTF